MRNTSFFQKIRELFGVGSRDPDQSRKGNYILEASRATALTEIDSDFRKSGRVIIPLTVREVLDEEISRKLA